MERCDCCGVMEVLPYHHDNHNPPYDGYDYCESCNGCDGPGECSRPVEPDPLAPTNRELEEALASIRAVS